MPVRALLLLRFCLVLSACGHAESPSRAAGAPRPSTTRVVIEAVLAGPAA